MFEFYFSYNINKFIHIDEYTGNFRNVNQFNDIFGLGDIHIGMRISITKIKGWDFQTRLQEIDKRLKVCQEEYGESSKRKEIYSEVFEDTMNEVCQIVMYWKSHIKSKEDKPKKRRVKSVNIF